MRAQRDVVVAGASACGVPDGALRAAAGLAAGNVAGGSARFGQPLLAPPANAAGAADIAKAADVAKAADIVAATDIAKGADIAETAYIAEPDMAGGGVPDRPHRGERRDA